MELPEQLTGRSDTDLETWFLEALDLPEMPLDHMLGVLENLSSAGTIPAANSLAELLQEALVGRANGEGVFRLLKTVSAWRSGEDAFRQFCKDALSAVFKDRKGTAYILSAGFDQSIPANECLRRFEVLLALKPDSLCYDKTWGFGIARKLDDFYQKVTIDFDRKQAHQMSYAYACESLEMLAENHILAVKHRDPARLAELVANSPAEVVKMTISSYGPASAPRLKELLAPDLVKEEAWKDFWDSARKVLKEDPMVDLPAKRSDPIRLRMKKKEYDDEWFAALKKERDPETILKLAEEFENEAGAGSPLKDEWKASFSDRFAFVIKGCRGNRADIVGRAVMAAKRLGLDGSGTIDVAATTRTLLDAEQFLSAVSAMPARSVTDFIRHTAGQDAAATEGVLVSLLPRLSMNVLAEATGFLLNAGRERDVADSFVSQIAAKTASPVMLFWLCRNLEWVEAHKVIGPLDLFALVVESLKEGRFGGENLRAQNQLRQLLGQGDWLENTMGRMSGDEKKSLVAKLNMSRSVDDVTKRSLLARIIKIFPELRDMLTGSDEGDGGGEAQRGHVTSWRSYRERQEQLRVLTEKTIPANSREIALARSYGDLSENHEYKAAKEMQGILLKRKGELERDLQSVRGADFSGMRSDRVGVGTCVEVKRPDGTVLKYCILGEWDRDEGLGIISSESRIAKLLDGVRAGQEVMLPAAGGAASGDEKCMVLKVSGLPEEVRSWAL
jgi:transcription elongation GreA/GreB family factor